MQINFYVEDFEIDKKTKDYIIKKINSLSRILSSFKEEPSFLVEIFKEKNKIFRIKIKLDLKKKVFIIERTGESVKSIIDLVKDELKTQLRRYKEKLEEKER